MKLQDIIEAASPWVKEDFGKWFITASKNRQANGKFSASAKDKRNPNIFQKAEGDSVAAAISAVKDKVSKPDYPTADNIQITLNFNVQFTTMYLSQHEEPYYFTLDQKGNDVYLVMAGEYFMSELEIIKELGFRQANKRLSTDIVSMGATQAWAVNIPLAKSQGLKLVVNGRYTIGEPYTNSEGNEEFKLTFASLVSGEFDKVRLQAPALTVIPRK